MIWQLCENVSPGGLVNRIQFPCETLTWAQYAMIFTFHFLILLHFFFFYYRMDSKRLSLLYRTGIYSFIDTEKSYNSCDIISVYENRIWWIDLKGVSRKNKQNFSTIERFFFLLNLNSNRKSNFNFILNHYEKKITIRYVKF